MKLLSSLRTFIDFLFHRRRIEREMDEEFRTHLEIRAEDLQRQGLSHVQAERQARIEFGSHQRYKEECRETLGTRLLQELFADVRYGFRQLRRNPGFTAVVILTLALGIGGNIAVFSVVDAVLLRPLPFKHPGHIVWINGAFPLGFTSKPGFEWRSWAKGTKTLKDISVYTTGDVNWAGRGHPARIPAAEVSDAFFRLLGVQPLRGRTFAASEDAANRPSVVILSYSLWKAGWPSRRGALGQTVQVNGRPFTVVGIMPRGFNFPNKSRFWFPFPLALSGQMFGKNSIMERTLARLRPGFSIQQAAAEMEVIGKRDAEEDKSPTIPVVRVKTLHQALAGNTRPALILLFGAVGLVLLIACADAANLLLSHNAGRFREVAVRSALGASRWRLMRQLVAESLLLSLMGGAVGLLLGWWVTDLVRVVIPSYVPLTSRIGMDRWVLLFTLIISVATGIVAGLIPGLRSTRVNLVETLKEGGHDARAGEGARMGRLRSAFGVAEIALAFILLAGAVLAIRSFGDLVRVKPGFRTDHLLTTRLALLGPAYKSHSSKLEFYDRALRRAQALPGVRGAAFANVLPLNARTWSMIYLDIQGHSLPAKFNMKDSPLAFYTVVTPSYFHVMGIPFLKGRDFSGQDTKGSTRVAIISQTMAQRYWGKEDAVGKRFRFLGKGNKWLEVVGEIGNIRSMNLGVAPRPQMYVPLAQQTRSSGYLLVRTAGKPMAVAGSLTDIIHSIDPEEPVSSYFTMNQVLSQSVASPRFRSILLGAFAGLALLLAIAGVYGVMSYSVIQHTHEIGIRMALGAQKSDVLGMVVRQGLKLALIGVAIGIASALALTRFLSSLLYGVKPTDPLTFGAVSLILIAVALLACYIPARRACRVDPMVALRYE